MPNNDPAEAARLALLDQEVEETPIEILPDGRIQRAGEKALPEAGSKMRMIDEKGEYASGRGPWAC